MAQRQASASRKKPRAPTKMASLGKAGSRRAGNLMTAVIAGDTIEPEALAAALGIGKAQLAQMLGLPTDAFYRPLRTRSGKTQSRLREAVEILQRIEPWAGGRLQAVAWFRGQSIAALGDQTAESLVRAGEADLVRGWLDGIAAGGYA